MSFTVRTRTVFGGAPGAKLPPLTVTRITAV